MTEKSKKIATRESILNADIAPKSKTLPSGKTVLVQSISIGMVESFYSRREKYKTDKNPGFAFTSDVIGFMLEENSEKNFADFDGQDQIELINLAVANWGCKKEFDEFQDIISITERFHLAAIKNIENMYESIRKSITSIQVSLAPTLEIANSLNTFVSSQISPISDALNFSNIISDELRRTINHLVESQARLPFPDIGQIIPKAQFEIPDFSNFVSDDLKNSVNQLIEKVRLPLPEISQIVPRSLLEYNNDLLSSIYNIIPSYQNLLSNFRNSIETPSTYTIYPIIEMNNLSIATGNIITGDDDSFNPNRIIESDADEINLWLTGINPQLSNMLEGARDSLSSDNHDRSRHFAISHRELCTHLLHILAPNEQVIEWNDDPNLIINKKPTRRARLKYIAREFDDDSFIEFVIKDFENQFKLLNADTHKKEVSFSRQQMELLHQRFLTMIGFIMQINLYNK
jgi:hypothetical protein